MKSGQLRGHCYEQERGLLWSSLGTLREEVRGRVGYFTHGVAFTTSLGKGTAVLSRLAFLCLQDIFLSMSNPMRKMKMTNNSFDREDLGQ